MSRLEELATDESFLARMHGLAADLDHYLQDPRWYQHQVTIGEPAAGSAIAYFSMEFGVTEVLPNYSGGLGILAGDHLKSASDLGCRSSGSACSTGSATSGSRCPRTAGSRSTTRRTTRRGCRSTGCWAPTASNWRSACRCRAAGTLTARIWCAQVGRVPLLLLDADNEANDDFLRATTDKLYGGDQDHRIKQEILLGIGGVRAVQRLRARRPGTRCPRSST